MFKEILQILNETTFCYSEGTGESTGNFKIIETYSYKTDSTEGNALTIKITPEFRLLFENKKFVRAFDYEVIRQLKSDYTTIHFYLFSLQRTFKKNGPEAHINIKEFLKECGSTFQDSLAFFRKIKNVVIPKLLQILKNVYGNSFNGLFDTAVNLKTKAKRIIIRMGRCIIPKKNESLTGFLKRCAILMLNHGLLAKEKLSTNERERLFNETGKHLEDLVKLSPYQLRKMLILS